MKKIVISVIIPTYNNGSDIINPINSINNQLEPTNRNVEYEIIVIDDCSTPEKLKEVELIVKNEKNCKLIKSEKNGGPSVARNLGLKQASGQFISFLDSDDLWPENKISLLLPLLENKNILIAGGKVKYIIDEGIDLDIDKWEDDQQRITHVHLGALLIKKEIIEKGYFFDEELRYSEDVDWWTRVREDGIGISILEETTLIYRIHGGNMTYKQTAALNRSLLQVINKAIKRRKGKDINSKIPQIKDFRKQREDMLVSVIIPMYNGKKSIGRAIQSVMNQTYKNIEIILVDDGSTDGGLDWVKENFPDLTIIEQENKGVSAARNIGVRQSNGDLIAFIDDDDAWMSEKLEKQLAEIKKDPYCGWVTCNQKFFWEENVKRPFFFKADIEKIHRSYVPSSWLIRKHILVSLNGFDESLRMGEDLDLLKRMNDNKIKGSNVDELLLEKWHDGNNLTFNFEESKKSILELLHKQIKKGNEQS